jgi:hypothetical protein
MFEALARDIEELEIPLDGDALGEALALADRLDAKLAEAIGEFDRHELWDVDGATSMTAWLRDRGGLVARRARHLVAVACRLLSLPVTSAAWRAGDLNGGQVESITAAVDDNTVDLFSCDETELVPALTGLSTTDTARAMAVWRAHATADGAEPADADRSLHLSRTLDGTGAIDGTLSPEGYSLVKTALRLAQMPDAEGDPVRTPAQRRHDALADVCRYFLDHQQTRRGGRHRPHLNVIVDIEAIAAGSGGRGIDGPEVDGVTVARLLCDSAVHRVVMAGRSTVLDYGTTTRTTPTNLWNALVVRDEGCRWPACDRPSAWCEAHHVQWVSDGGATRPDNQALLCSRHHHIAHQPGWKVELLADATLVVSDPKGRTRTTRPPGELEQLVA